MIDRNTERRPKPWTDLGQGEKIAGYVADNEHDEARFIAGEIDRLVDEGVAYGDIPSCTAPKRLPRVGGRAHALRCRTRLGHPLYERKEIRDIVSYSVLDNPEDTVALPIINTPREASATEHSRRSPSMPKRRG